MSDLTDAEVFAEGVRRQSLLILDNVGIMVRMDELPGVVAFYAAKRLRYGDNWKTRLWGRKVRGVLFPGLQADVELIWDNAQQQRQREFWTEVMKQGREMGYVYEPEGD